MLDPERLKASIESDNDSMVEARVNAAFLFSHDSPMGGAYTVDELRKHKIQLGRRVAREVPALITEGIGLNLRLARERARLTQNEAAMSLGISAQTLRKIESDRRRVTLDEIVSMAVLYGTHVERLLGTIDSDMERLLDVYEASAPSVRRQIMNVIESARTDNPSSRYPAESMAARDWDEHIQKLNGDTRQI